MKNNKKFRRVIISLIFCIFTATIIISNTGIGRAADSIPNNFYQELDLDSDYIYNITNYNSNKPLQWLNLTWGTRAYTNTTIGGQIIIHFTGFYDKDPNDIFNLFGSPMPYMDIKFFEKEDNELILNHTLTNVSNGEADLNLLIGYNEFKSGFLIPTNNFENLTNEAIEQDKGFFLAKKIEVKEFDNKISFEFIQNSTIPQKTKSIYSKGSGILLYTNTSYGNYTLEMSLTNPPEIRTSIPSYPALFLSSIIIITIITISFNQRNKIKKKSI